MINREQSSFVIGFEASNGQEALGALEKETFDLVLCDVVMPVMDGIAFLREYRKRNLKAPVIMLSNFDEYDKVRQAFKLGARDYILKDSATGGSLLRLLEEYCRNREMPDETYNFQSLVREALDGYSSPPFSALSQYVQSRVSGSSFRLLYLDMPQKDLSGEKDLFDTMCEIFRDHIVFSAITTQHHGIVLVHTALPLERKELQAIFENLQKSFPHTCGVLSRALTSLSDFRAGCERLHEAAAYAIYRSPPLFFSEEEIPPSHPCEPFPKERFLSLVKEQDLAGARETLMSFWEQTAAGQAMEPAAFKRQLEDVLFQTIQELKPFFQESMAMTRLQIKLLKELDYAYSREQITGIVESLFEGVHRQLPFLSQKQGTAVRDVMRYIADHYREPVTLQDAAAALHLNYTYLSSCVTQNTGKSFIEHLNAVRIKEAKRLLKETEMTVGEISDAIGYRDQGYFGKVFKRLAGTTPLHYRNSCQRGDEL